MELKRFWEDLKIILKKVESDEVGWDLEGGLRKGSNRG